MKNTNHKLTPVEEAALYFYPYAVLDMMAEDYESRQRKKNKFGDGTSNKKDPEYEEQEDINGYNYVGKGDMRGLYQVPNWQGYKGYWTADGHPIGIDWETGNLVDEVTGEIGIMNLPEITVTGTEKPHTYATSMSGNLPLGPTIFNSKGVSEPTLGQKAEAVEDVSRGMRVLSPAAWMDTAYDAMYTPEEINFPWMEGNQGLGDPFLDILFDAGVYGGLSKASQILNTADKLKSNNLTDLVFKINMVRDPKNSPISVLRPLGQSEVPIKRLLRDLRTMSHRLYIDKSGKLYFSDGILPEDMADYSSPYRTFYDRINSLQQDILHKVPTHTIMNIPLQDLKAWLSRGSHYHHNSHDPYVFLNPLADAKNLGLPKQKLESYPYLKKDVGYTKLHEDIHAILQNDPKYQILIKNYKDPRKAVTLFDMDYDIIISNLQRDLGWTKKEAETTVNYLFRNGCHESITRLAEGLTFKNIKEFKTNQELVDALAGKAQLIYDNDISELLYIITNYGNINKFREFSNTWTPLLGAPIAAKIAQDKINQKKINYDTKR